MSDMIPEETKYFCCFAVFAAATIIFMMGYSLGSG